MKPLSRTLLISLLSLVAAAAPAAWANTVHYQITGTLYGALGEDGKPTALDLLPRKQARLDLEFDVTAPTFAPGGWDGRDFYATVSDASYRVGGRRRPVTIGGIGYFNLYAKGFIYFDIGGLKSTEQVTVGFAISGIANPYFTATPTGPVLTTGVFNPGLPLASGDGLSPAEQVADVFVDLISAPYDRNAPYGVGLGDSLIRVTCDTDEDWHGRHKDKDGAED